MIDAINQTTVDKYVIGSTERQNTGVESWKFEMNFTVFNLDNRRSEPPFDLAGRNPFKTSWRSCEKPYFSFQF